MKRIVEKEVTICDVCGEQADFGYCCIECGAEHCYNCSEVHGIEYSHLTWGSGTGDGYYCVKCNSELLKSGKDALHNAYLQIRNLRNESEGYNKTFRERSKMAEDALVKLLKEK